MIRIQMIWLKNNTKIDNTSIGAPKNILILQKNNMLENERTRLNQNNDERWYKDRSGILGYNTGSPSYGSDRGCIRVFEQGLAYESTKYSEYSTKYQIRQESERLIESAKRNGLFIPLNEVIIIGGQFQGLSRESDVYINTNKGDGVVVKVKDPFALLPMKGDNVYSVLYEHIAHNLLSPNTRYEFMGISEDVDGVRFVFEQKLINTFLRPTQQQLDRHFEKLGFERDDYYYNNDYLSIGDIFANCDNSLLGDDGDIYLIDPVIRFNKSVEEVLEYLEKRKK